MLLILCVDGLCPEQVEEKGYPSLPYHEKLSIPLELYYEGMPHTLLVWPSLFQGFNVDFDLRKTIDIIYSRDNWNFRMRKLAQKIGLNKVLRKLKVNYSRLLKPVNKQYHIQPFIHEIDNVFDHYPSATWNIPGINPECVVGFPTIESFLPYIKRQYQNWKNLTWGMAFRPKILNAAYTNILDGLSHRKQPTDPFYLDLQVHIELLRKTTDVDIMLVSDHGSTSEGDHTDFAYLGCTRPITAKSIIDVRLDIEKILGGRAHEVS